MKSVGHLNLKKKEENQAQTQILSTSLEKMQFPSPVSSHPNVI